MHFSCIREGGFELSSISYIRGKLNEIKDNITEKMFLMSNAFRVYLQDIARGTSGNYDIKVELSQDTATDGKIIWINTVHPFHMKLPLVKKVLCIVGSLAHELFHILYTDFKTLEELKRKYLPKGEFHYNQAHECMNIVEDSAIELIGTNYYTGYFRSAIIFSNEVAYENMPSLEEMVAKKAPRLAIFKQACAMYAIIGKVKGALQDQELADMFLRAMPIMDRGRLALDCWGRLSEAEKLYRIMLPLIEEAERQQQQNDRNYQYPKNQKLSSGGKNAQPQTGTSSSSSSDFTKKNREKTKREMKEQQEQQQAQEKEEDSEQQSSSTSSPKKEEKKQEQNESASSAEQGKEDDSSKGSDQKSNSSDDKTGEEEDGSSKGDSSDEANRDDNGDSSDSSKADSSKQSDDEQEDEKSKEDGDAESNGNEPDESDEDSDEDEAAKLQELMDRLEDELDDVKENAAKEEYDKAAQREIEKQIQEFGKQVKYSDLHRHISTNAISQFSKDPKYAATYNQLFATIRPTVQNLIRALKRVINHNTDERLNGMVSGKLNVRQIYREDRKIFSKRKEKSDEADLAITLLIDQSGSMQSGSRIVHALLAAITVCEVCEALGIPLAIIGHSAKHMRNEVTHHHYVDFECRSGNQKANLLHMRTYDNTREGVSLQYAGEYLLKRPEADKILISISDGQPYHQGYGNSYMGEIAQKDSGRVVTQLERRGVKVFGLAIGDGKSEIRKIYTKNFIDIENLKQLPTRLVQLIERNLLKD
jgi:hypothetical protein